MAGVKLGRDSDGDGSQCQARNKGMYGYCINKITTNGPIDCLARTEARGEGGGEMYTRVQGERKKVEIIGTVDTVVTMTWWNDYVSSAPLARMVQ